MRESRKFRNWYQKLFYKLFSSMKKGSLKVSLSKNQVWTFGADNQVTANINVLHNNFFKKCVLYGDIGFAESYIDGDWETDSITDVINWMVLNVENHPTLMDDKQKRKPVSFLKVINKFYHLLRPNTLKGSRKNIGAHYDLSNDFFKLILDPTMTYSAAYYKSEDEKLEDAQKNKYDALCQKLRLKEEDKVLEIGSGWGGFATYAAKNYGCCIDTITISEEQFKYAKQKIEKEKLSGKVNLKFLDYRQLKGAYDKIVSVEMIEAVGHKFYKSFFKQCHALLKKDGILALQMILSPDHRYDSFRKNPDFIQKYIFPGSLLPSIDIIQKNLRRIGTLNLFDFEDITPHYTKTLKEWRDNFNLNLDRVKELGFNESFIRKWNYYFCYCEAAFNTRNISVAQAVFSRPNNLSLS